jgi:hypothetical protein
VSKHLRYLTTFAAIKVYKDPHAAAFHDDGSPRLFTLCRAANPPCVLVHPDRWDAFVAAVNLRTAFSESWPQFCLRKSDPIG